MKGWVRCCMTKKSNIDFCGFVMTHAKNKYPNATYYAPASIGAEPWVYLYGTTGVKVTQALLDERYEHHYNTKMSIEQYRIYTKGWVERGVTACDCEGLLDYFVGADVTANYCYVTWCKEKGIIETDLPFLSTPNAAGCAVFVPNEENKMTHVGFIIGRDSDGVPLVGEARGIVYGVTVTRLTERPFVYWGRPTEKLIYPSSNIIPATMPISNIKTDPANTDRITALQIMLTANGYPVTVDGKIGKETRNAIKAFIADNTEQTETNIKVVNSGKRMDISINGTTVYHEIK